MKLIFFLIFKQTATLKVTDILLFANLKDICFATTGCSNRLRFFKFAIPLPNLICIYLSVHFLQTFELPPLCLLSTDNSFSLASPEASLTTFLFSCSVDHVLISFSVPRRCLVLLFLLISFSSLCSYFFAQFVFLLVP